MIYSFIDTESGFTFNGNKPFTFWFDEGQSVNLYYAKKVAFISDSAQCHVRIDPDSIFKLFDTGAVTSAEHDTINFRDYVLLEGTDYSLLTDELTTEGAQFSGKYIHLVYIVAKSTEPGEYVDDFEIDNESFSIGADFYIENETLTSSLENLGIEISPSVQRAIYESNLYEESSDNILLNRKWKELLLEYWNIVARKGSYKSLVDSLKWFEYGDLVRILEYWKREDVHVPQYIGRDIQSILSDTYRSQLSVLSKSTYIGLYMALRKISEGDFQDDNFPFWNSNEVYENPYISDEEFISARGNLTEGWDQDQENGRIEDDSYPQILQIGIDQGDGNLESEVNTEVSNFDGADLTALDSQEIPDPDAVRMVLNEHIPVLKLTAMKWSATDMMLKMTLLGNFFSAYFMPIHLDLIHSTVEDVVFANTIKILNGTSWQRRDWADLSHYAYCSVKDDSVYFIQPAKVFVGPNTILAMRDSIPGVRILGIETDPSITGIDGEPQSEYTQEEIDINDLIFQSEHIYDTYGAIIPIHTEIDSNIGENSFLKGCRITWLRNGAERFTYTDYGFTISPVRDNDISKRYSFDFHIMIQKPGRYEISLAFLSDSSFEYSSDFSVVVLDDADNHISVYKTRRINPARYCGADVSVTDDGLYMSGPIDIESDFNEFMNTITKDKTDIVWRQFLCSSKDNFSHCAGMNHTLMIDTDLCDDSALLTGLDVNGNLVTASLSAADASDHFPHYWWIEKTAHTKADRTGLLSEEHTILIGVRKFFSTTRGEHLLIEREYHKGSSLYTLRGTQLGSVILFEKRKQAGDDISETFTRPAERQQHIDMFGDFELDLDLDTDDDSYSTVCSTDEYRVYLDGYCPRMVDEDRFIPLFHNLELVTGENYKIRRDEIVVASPEFDRTICEPDEIVMKFINSATGRELTKHTGVTDTEEVPMGISSLTSIQSFQNPAASSRPIVLEPGYYDVELRYRFGSVWHTERADGAFKII